MIGVLGYTWTKNGVEGGAGGLREEKRWLTAKKEELGGLYIGQEYETHKPLRY